MIRKITVEIICFLFILLFVYAALSKLIDLEKFRIQIGQSLILTRFAGPLATGVPILELVIATSLLVPKYRLNGFYGSFFLMTLFTFYIIYILNFADHIPCACGGILSKMGWTTHLVFNSVFVGLGLIGIMLVSKKNVNNQFKSMSS